MNKEDKKIIFEEINNLPIMKFVNADEEFYGKEKYKGLIDDLIIRIGCQVDRLNSSFFDYTTDDSLTEYGRRRQRTFEKFTSLKTKSFTYLLKETFVSIKNGNAFRYNLLRWRSDQQGIENPDEMKKAQRISDFYFMGHECSLYVQKAWEKKDLNKVYESAKEAHQLLKKLFTEITDSNLVDMKAEFRFSNFPKNENLIFNGFLRVLINLEDLDRRNFRLNQHIFFCGNPNCSRRFYIADTKSRNRYCCSECCKEDSNETKNQEFKNNF